MFKKIISLFIACVLLTGMIQAGLAAFADVGSNTLQANSDGIVAKYSFEDADNLGYDSVGGNHLKKNGSGEITQVDGSIGKAAYFDGNVILESDSCKDFTDSLTDYTITFWGQRYDTGNSEMVVVASGYREETPGVHINMNGGYFCSGHRSSENKSMWNWYQTDVSSAVHHYAVVVSNNGKKVTLYIDGTPVKEEVCSSGSLVMNNSKNPFSIGGLSNGSGWFGYALKGTLDEVTLYNRSLSGTEIASELNSRPAEIAHYSFEDPDNMGYDSVGGNHLKKIGNGKIEQAEGSTSKGARFDGTAILETSGRSDFTDSFTDYTIAFWAQRDASDLTSEEVAISTGYREHTPGVSVYFNPGEYFCVAHRRSTDENTSNFAWAWYQTDTHSAMHFYAFTVSGGNKLTVYMNGVVIKEETCASGSFAMNNSSHPFSIGGLSDGTGWYGWPFKGVIDEVSVYNYALSGSRIAELYGIEPTEKKLVARYSFEDAENLGKDSVGDNNLVVGGDGAITQIKGKKGNAAKFDGKTYLRTQEKSDFSDGFTDYSISFWGQRYDTGDKEMVAVASGYREQTPGMHINLNSGYFCTGHRSTENEPLWNWYQTDVCSAAHHYAVVVSNKGKTVTSYIDGTAVKVEYCTSGYYNMNNPNCPFALGAYVNQDGFVGLQFDGMLDEVEIYNYSLSSSEIEGLAQSLSAPELEENSMIARYTFDDINDIGNDSCGNFPLTNKGGVSYTREPEGSGSAYFGGNAGTDALYYDGVDFTDYLTDFTVSLFVKAETAPNGNACLISTGWDPAGGFSFGLTGSYTFFDGITKNGTVVWDTTAAGCSFTKGYHLFTLAVSNNGTKISIYVDEDKVNELELDSKLNVRNNLYGLVLGQNAWFDGYTFNGWMNEVRIYNYAVSDSDVKDIFKAVGGVSTEIVVPVRSMMAKYLFEDAGNLGKDSLGRFDLSIKGKVNQISDGYNGSAAYFRGDSPEDMMYYEGKDFIDSLSEITINFFARQNNSVLSDNAAIISTGWDTTGGISLGFAGTNVLFCDTRTKNKDVIWNTVKTGVATDEEYHGYTLSITNGGRTLSYYVDGKYVSGQTYESPVDLNGKFGIVIGAVCWGGGYLYSGALDELSIYNYGLSAKEVAALYGVDEKHDENLISYYSFDSAGEIGRDSVGSHHLSNKGCVSSYANGYKGRSAYFAGIDWQDYLFYDGKDFLRDYDEFTIHCYAKVEDDVTDNACLVSTGWNGGKGLSFGVRPKNGVFFDSETEKSTVVWDAYVSDVKANEDYHAYTMTYSAKDLTVKTYVDGELGSEVKLDSPLNLNSNHNFSIGQAAWAGYMFRGWIDEFAVYNKAFSENQINKMFSKITENPAGVFDDKPQSNGLETESDNTADTPQTSETKFEAAEIPNQTVKNESNEETSKTGIIILISVIAIGAAGGICGAVYCFGKKSKA